MKANELRIGNYISNQDGTLNNIPIGEPHIVNETDFKWAEFYVPIPLTEEWLLKFGLNNYLNRRDLFNLGGYSVLLTTETLLFYIGANVIELKYVHQLQNLYFALTGEELTLKDKL